MTKAARPPWWKNWKFMVPVWAVMACIDWWAIESRVEPTVIAGGVVGPLVVAAFTTGFLMLINAISSIIAYVAVKRGYTRDMLTFKGVTITLIIGVAIGFIIGRLIP